MSTVQILELFRDASPSPADTSCEIELQSFFYPELAEMAAELQEEA